MSINIEELLKELEAIPEVEAIAMGGSRAGNVYDEKSDYDIYLYCMGDIDEAVRKEILSQYCTVMEIGNHFWEYEDNCTLKNGIDIDILYRNLESFTQELALVVEQYQAHNGYTTCMWHNLLNSKILFDIIFARNGLTHPGEKRLVQLCRQQCKCLPDRFEENINKLFTDLFCDMDCVKEDIREIIRELEVIL